jgi:acetyl-CoA C-acetyltransferase
VICSIARTPIGKLNGAFADLPAVALGGAAVAAALDRAGVDPAAVDGVIFGHVIRAGQGQNTARQAAFRGGIPLSVPATTVDKVCLSGMTAIADASRRIRLGEGTLLVAGGMESMTGAPYLLPGARRGYRYGDATAIDALLHDGLWCAFDQCSMGEASDAKGRELGIGRAEQDAWAVESHRRAHAAVEAGAFDDEIVPVTVPVRRGDPVTVDRDEGIRPGTTVEAMGALRPAFGTEGTITAGNASQISDGAAAVVVASAEAAAAAGLPVLAEIVASADSAGPDASLYDRPADALRRALDRAGLTPDDLDLVEINEAFASVALWATRRLGLSPGQVNVHGGAVALGHPLGATGARIVVTLVSALRRRGGGVGAAALCGGGGQGEALIVRVPVPGA